MAPFLILVSFVAFGAAILFGSQATLGPVAIGTDTVVAEVEPPGRRAGGEAGALLSFPACERIYTGRNTDRNANVCATLLAG